jgi:hypothetical protein
MNGFHDPFNGQGKIVKQYPDKIIWMLETEDQIVYCTQKLVDPILGRRHPREHLFREAAARQIEWR